MRLALCCTALLGLLVSPALASVIQVCVLPASQTVDIALGTTTVDIVADIPSSAPLIGWGLDLNLVGTSVAMGGVTIGPLFDAAYAPDGDNLAALTKLPPGEVWGTGILLATVTLNLVDYGVTALTPGADDPVFEGLMTLYGFVPFDVCTAYVNVVPEPAALALAALGLLLRRR